MNDASALRQRRQERIETLCAAALRALSGERDLHYRGGRLQRGRRALPLYAPHLRTQAGVDDLDACRGAADGYALRLRGSDAALHRQLAPADAVERMVFELLEQLRCESRVPASLAGVRDNLRRRFESWSLAFHAGGGTEGARGLLLYTVAQMARARVCDEPVHASIEDLLEATRAGLAPRIGVALAGCRRERDDQAAYAVHARAIAATVAALLRDADDGRAGADEARGDEAWAAFSLLPDESEAADAGYARAVSGRSAVLEAAPQGYRVYTTAYDREVAAATLVRREQLAEYRRRLDELGAGLGANAARLARDLQALLAQPARDGWDGGQEEGRIDGRRLAQLIASPTERRLFRVERDEPRADALVTLLVDCSGSMKAHIEAVAPLAEVLLRALEQAGVASELLGYTTGAWNGGRARRDWQRAGQPRHPGRLGEACHLVFKDAATPWRRARPSIAALLRAELFREGLDGEAVQWALRRMDAHGARRRLLIVISDGSPMDSATNLANDAHYLDHHLRQVVERAEAQGAEILGLGVGLDLSPYYSRSHVLDLAGTPARTWLREVLALIDRRAARR